MKKLVLISTLLLYTSISFSQTGTIDVNISGITNQEGKVEIGLYNQEVGFTKYDQVFQGVSLDPSTSDISYSFKDIPTGTYALAVWHDEDMNKEINTNMFGAPNESHGFSLNKFGTFGPPKFDDVSFDVKEGEIISLTIQLKN